MMLPLPAPAMFAIFAKFAKFAKFAIFITFITFITFNLVLRDPGGERRLVMGAIAWE
jgi:hypothetical protein